MSGGFEAAESDLMASIEFPGRDLVRRDSFFGKTDFCDILLAIRIEVSLTGPYTGSGLIAKTGATQTFSISGTVTGGKGAYALSKGTISGMVVVNPQTGSLTINYTLRVRPVAV